VDGTVDVNTKGSMVMLQSKVIIDPAGSGLCVVSTDCTIQGFAFKNTSFSINEGAYVFMHENSFDIVTTAFFINILTVLAGATINARRRNRDRTDNSHGHNTFFGNRGTSGGRSFIDIESKGQFSFSELVMVGNSGSRVASDSFRNDGGAIVDVRFGGSFVGRELTISGCDNGSGRGVFAGGNAYFNARVASFFNVEQECMLMTDSSMARIEALYAYNVGSATCATDSSSVKVRTAFVDGAQAVIIARHCSSVQFADNLNRTVTGEENNEYGNIEVALVRAERGACVNFQTAPSSVTGNVLMGNIYSKDAIAGTLILEEYAEVGNVDGNLVSGTLDGAVCDQFPVLILSPP
jgi:hypothetical protein